jgi:hypothetical protein
VLELEFVINGITGMIKKPEEFFRDVHRREVNLLIPVIVLMVTGIIMAVMTFYQLPKLEEAWRQTGVDQVYNLEYRKSVETWKAILYPIWNILYWALFTLAFATTCSSLNGWSEFKSYFNCTAFIIYPYALLQIIKLILTMIPGLMFVYTILLFLLCIWTIYLLTVIAKNVGQLENMMHAVFAAIIPGFFLTILWLAYDPIISMIIINPKY